MRYGRVITEIYRKPWAILPEKFAVIEEIVALRASGKTFSEKEIRARLAPHLEAAAGRSGAQTYGVVAVIPIYGVISQRISLMTQVSGGASVEKITSQFRQALADSSVQAIVFDVDSPGGAVEGVPELAEEIFKSRGKKKTVAVANGLAASAAYWLASAAGEFVVAPSGEVGSIGVFCAHEDLSAALEKQGIKISLISAGKYKTDGNSYEPLTPEARADMQAKVNTFYEMFVKDVARSRGASQASVRNGFGEGRLVLASDALKEGMVDRVATMDQTLARLGAVQAKRMTAAAVPPRLAAAESFPEGGDDDDTECSCECGPCAIGSCEACANEACANDACSGAGCPNQAEETPAAPPAAPDARKSRAMLERELRIRTR
jgi:signal peptide peptidase SppA